MVKLPYSFLNDLSIFFITPAENAYLNRKLFTEAQEGNKRKLGQWGCVCLCVFLCVCFFIKEHSCRNVCGFGLFIHKIPKFIFSSEKIKVKIADDI